MNKDNIQEQPEVIEQPIKCGSCKRCSDFDEDCELVPDKVHCFLHGTWANAQKLPQGYCPYIHTEN